MKNCNLVILLCVLSLTQIFSLPTVVKFDQKNINFGSENINDRIKLHKLLFGKQNEQSKKNEEAGQCGYKGCNLGKPDMLNVHLVAHTHDDVGWLKTVDQYYYGARSDIQQAGVQYILDTVVRSLLDDPERRFIYVEIAFFYRWWNEQDDSMRHTVKRLVNEGRLEFILGGWCMNDEAATHYNAIIDQHTLGFQFLSETFGECAMPHIGWQIDPFGHSREQASIFAQFGFDGYFFGRLDYQDKDKRLKDKTMESMWMASQNLGEQASLLTGVNFNGYGPPSGFCFQCGDTPLMDDPRLEDYNVDSRIMEFIKAAKEQSLNYTTNHIMMTMGSDFQYENAHMNFKNLDKLIKYVNMLQATGSKVNVMYSTPGCYLYALNQANQTYTQKGDDFFPYASSPHTFWTGYFTSRPAVKGYVRMTNNFLQVCKQLHSLAGLDYEGSTQGMLGQLKRAMGVLQHHDAVSGTEKQHVADDYALRLSRGTRACEDLVNYAFERLLPKPGTEAGPAQHFCELNVTKCHVSEDNKQFTVTLYNPVARPVTFWVRVPVVNGQYSVMDNSLALLPSQLVPVSQATKQVPAYNGSRASQELVFAAAVPPLGFNTFFVQQKMEHTVKEERFTESKMNEVIQDAADTVISNSKLKVTFDGMTGLMKELVNTPAGITLPLQQTLQYYKSMAGNNSKDEFRASGAYVFRPNGTEPENINTKVQTTVNQGSEVQEVVQVFGDWASQVIRLYKDAPYLEIEYTVGPIPFQDGIGKEVISRFTSDLQTSKTFYTDSNGREVLRRVRDFRPTWNLNQTEPVAGNYYPVNSRIFIRDMSKNVQLTVLNDRSQGGASINDGQLELMVHRRMFHDDAFGVGEALNETGITGKGLVIRGKLYVLVDTIKDSPRQHRDLAERLFMQPAVMFATPTVSPADYVSKYNTQWSGLMNALPDNVHLLTLEPWSHKSYLVRLEHFYENGEDATLSQPAKVSLKGLFKTLEVESVEELTLGANQKLSEAKRLQWNIEHYGTTSGDMASYVTPFDPITMDVVLKPMQIRTFEVTVKKA